MYLNLPQICSGAQHSNFFNRFKTPDNRALRGAQSLARLLVPVVLFLGFASGAMAQGDVNSPPSKLRYSAIKTAASAGSLEAMVVDGGDWFSLRHLSHVAILVQHPKGDLLYDTGIGSKVEEQLEVLNILDKQLFAIEGLNPARAQLDQASYPMQNLMAIVVGHMHWDHVSGLEDFLGVPVWVPEEALAEAEEGEPPGFIHSQFDDERIAWEMIRLDNKAYMGFETSRDVFGDGSVVLVDLSGHADGQMGMFINVPEGERVFLIGDTTWTLKGLETQRSRPRFVQWMTGVDKDYEGNAELIHKIHALSKSHPDIKIVPAHDEYVLETLPVFPAMSDGNTYQPGAW